jgi:hypothetical protein
MNIFVIGENKSIIFRLSGEGVLQSWSINNRECDEKMSRGNGINIEKIMKKWESTYEVSHQKLQA